MEKVFELALVCALIGSCAALVPSLDYQDLLDNMEYVPRLSLQRRDDESAAAVTLSKRSPDSLKHFLHDLDRDAWEESVLQDGKGKASSWRLQKARRHLRAPEKRKAAAAAEATPAQRLGGGVDEAGGPPATAGRAQRSPPELVPYPVFIPRLLLPHPLAWTPLLPPVM